MFKHMRAASVVCVFVLASMAAPVVSAAAPSRAADFPDLFWSELMMKSMDANKDGMVSREEFLNYMGSQFDKMDQNKDRMLTMKEFTDKKMMSTTFPSSASELR
jgi:EF hand domain-containing protein